MVLSQELTQERIRALEEEGRTWAQIRAHPVPLIVQCSILQNVLRTFAG